MEAGEGYLVDNTFPHVGYNHDFFHLRSIAEDRAQWRRLSANIREAAEASNRSSRMQKEKKKREREREREREGRREREREREREGERKRQTVRQTD